MIRDTLGVNAIHDVDAGLDPLFVSPVGSLVPYGRNPLTYVNLVRVVHWGVVRLTTA